MQQLSQKHPSNIWVKAEHRVVGDMIQFNEIVFSRAPQFAAFLSLIKAGKITCDWRGCTTKTGKYSAKPWKRLENKAQRKGCVVR